MSYTVPTTKKMKHTNMGTLITTTIYDYYYATNKAKESKERKSINIRFRN